MGFHVIRKDLVKCSHAANDARGWVMFPSEIAAGTGEQLGRELINEASGGLPESALEPRAALGRRKRHFRKVPIPDIQPMAYTTGAAHQA